MGKILRNSNSQKMSLNALKPVGFDKAGGNRSSENELLEFQHSSLRKVQFVELQGATVIFQQIDPIDKQITEVAIESPSIQMNFVLEGERQYMPASGYGPPCHLTSGQHCLAYYTAMNGKLTYGAEGSCFLIDIIVSEAYLRSVFQDDLTQLNSFGKAIEKKQSAVLGNRNFALTLSQKDVLLAMHACPLQGQLQKLFIEGKLLELLALQVGQFQENTSSNASDVVKREDIEKFHTIRDALNQNLTHPPSLKELTILVGMNRTKLMSGFKELFGKTIFTYVADLRMERAKELMANDRYIKIAEVARLVGFKSPNNFSIAFKKKFGYSPNRLR